VPEFEAIVNVVALSGHFLRRLSSAICAVGSKSAMIEIRPDAGAGFIMLRFSGVQTHEDIAGVVAAVIQLCKSRDGMRLLCDWSDVRGWACETKSLPVHEWVTAAGRVERVAVLHHHRWNRQAAWLAAMLRRENVRVRCGHLRDPAGARKWLLASSDDLGAF
jgi:SpoIIAA-like